MNTIIDRYSDYRYISDYGTFDAKSNTSTVEGKMFIRTVKIRNIDGSVGLSAECITDLEMEEEIFGEDDSDE